MRAERIMWRRTGRRCSARSSTSSSLSSRRGACCRWVTSLDNRSLGTIFSDDTQRLVHTHHAIHRCCGGPAAGRRRLKNARTPNKRMRERYGSTGERVFMDIGRGRAQVTADQCGHARRHAKRSARRSDPHLLLARGGPLTFGANWRPSSQVKKISGERGNIAFSPPGMDVNDLKAPTSRSGSFDYF